MAGIDKETERLPDLPDTQSFETSAQVAIDQKRKLAAAAARTSSGETAPVGAPELPPGTTRVASDAGGPLATDASVNTASAPVAGTAPQLVSQERKGGFQRSAFDGFDVGQSAEARQADNSSAPANSFSATPEPRVASGAHVSPEAPTPVVGASHAPTVHSNGETGRSDIAATARARTVIGKAVLQNGDLIDIAGTSLLLLIEDRLEALRQARLNTDEAQAAIDGYQKLKARIETFLAQATQFKAGQTNEQELVNTKTSFADTLNNWWTRRHVEALDVALFGVALVMCTLADPLSVLVSGTLVGGKSMVKTFKAAAKIVTPSDHQHRT